MVKITKRNTKQGLFAFVDLLGFSDRVKAIKSEEQLRKLDSDVVYAQDQFELKSEDATIKESHRVSGKRVLAFSDCIVISVGLDSKIAELQGSYDVLVSELHSFGLAQGACVLNEIFIRGGVDVGFWFKRKDTLISPAMVGAYELEGSACVPMIALTPALRTYLQNHGDGKNYSTDPLKTIIKQKRRLPNGKSHWFINYIPICLEAIEPVLMHQEQIMYKALTSEARDRWRSETRMRRCRDWALRHRDVVHAAHSAASSDRVRVKYEWLTNYHNSEIKKFFGSEARSLLINT